MATRLIGSKAADLLPSCWWELRQSISLMQRESMLECCTHLRPTKIPLAKPVSWGKLKEQRNFFVQVTQSGVPKVAHALRPAAPYVAAICAESVPSLASPMGLPSLLPLSAGSCIQALQESQLTSGKQKVVVKDTKLPSQEAHETGKLVGSLSETLASSDKLDDIPCQEDMTCPISAELIARLLTDLEHGLLAAVGSAVDQVQRNLVDLKSLAILIEDKLRPSITGELVTRPVTNEELGEGLNPHLASINEAIQDILTILPRLWSTTGMEPRVNSSTPLVKPVHAGKTPLIAAPSVDVDISRGLRMLSER